MRAEERLVSFMPGRLKRRSPTTHRKSDRARRMLQQCTWSPSDNSATAPCAPFTRARQSIRYAGRLTMPEMDLDAPLRICPAWTCEVLSPSNTRTVTVKKQEVYARSGVEWLWLVNADPPVRS
jgi:Uma2 family endonuclease